jgi:hypothetical protein
VTNMHPEKPAKELLTVGFTTIASFFPIELIEKLEACIVDLYRMQAGKIGEYSQTAKEIQLSSIGLFDKFSRLYELMEKEDKEALYQVQKFFPSSPIMRELFDAKFLDLVRNLLKSSSNSLLVDGPALFVNRPNTERLLYKWHSEAHYYPKRRRFLNIWLPLFDRKSKESGTMSFKIASHKSDFPFSDYQGFNRNSQNMANYFVQYEIPSNFLDKFGEHWCETERGDLVIFDRSLVHRSNQNLSNSYSVALVARVWDPTDDLTLSGDIAATPYGGNIGRSNLNVEPF